MSASTVHATTQAATGRRQAAWCHPKRAMVGQGLCKTCFADQNRRQTRSAIDPQMALARVLQVGEERTRKEVLGYLQFNLEEYARLHIEATRMAAVKGDARPAEWALQTIKLGDQPVVAPVAKDGTSGAGIKVLIGVQLGGLPPGTQTVTVSPDGALDTTDAEKS